MADVLGLLAQHARSELRVAWAILATNVRASAEFRVAFALQIFGMVLNDVAFLVVWVIFFTASGPINGWSTTEIVALQGFVTAAFGVSHSLGAGAQSLPALVRTGALDALLTSPRSIALRIWTAKASVSALGDLLYGLILLGTAVVLLGPSVERVVLVLALLIPTSVLFATMLLAAALPSFLLPDGEGVAGNLYEVFLSPALNPSGVLSGWLRTFFIFAVPSIAAGSMPVEALRDLSWMTVGIIWAIAVAWLALTLALLRFGLRRYESGNLTGVHV